MEENIIELKNISKVFPNGVIANEDISLEIKKGEIHSIVGENGAGKSTLMNTIFGLHKPTSGEIKIRGKVAKFSSSRDAIAEGLGMVHQHFMLINKFTVTENIILGMEVGTKFKIDYKKARQEVLEISEQYGLNIDPDALVSNISVPMQQRVEILKVLYRQAEVLIFDEPTAVLTPQEIEEFCEIMQRLRKQGKTIVFISHKLGEVMKISDRISIIRLGKLVGTKNVEDTDENDLTVLMVGREVNLSGGERKTVEGNDVLIDIKNVSYSVNNVKKLSNVNLDVKQGEIVGVAGVDGNGQEELVKIISGLSKADEGSVHIINEDISSKSIKDIKNLGLSVIYEDRHKEGLVMPFSIYENLILGYEDKKSNITKKLFLNKKHMFKQAEKLRKDFDIRTNSIKIPVSTLSGGNQQKVIIAREVHNNPKVIMAVQPTRGLDLGAIGFVHDVLVEERNKGKGVLLFSLELDEILQVCDRVAVIFKGEIVKIFKNENLTKEMLGSYMLGAKGNEQ